MAQERKKAARRSKCRGSGSDVSSQDQARKQVLGGERIRPRPIRPEDTLEQVLAKIFWAYNGARLKESCRLFSEKMLKRNVTVGVSLAGA